MWQALAAVTGEDRAGGPIPYPRLQEVGEVWKTKKGAACADLGTDRGKAGPGCYGHCAAPGYQGGTTP